MTEDLRASSDLHVNVMESPPAGARQGPRLASDVEFSRDDGHRIRIYLTRIVPTVLFLKYELSSPLPLENNLGILNSQYPLVISRPHARLQLVLVPLSEYLKRTPDIIVCNWRRLIVSTPPS